MRYHQGGELVLGDKALGEVHDYLGITRIEGCGMLVEQQHFRLAHDSHKQCECLALATAEEPDIVLEPVLQTNQLQKRAELFPLFIVEAYSQALHSLCFGGNHIVLDGHVCSRSLGRVLENASDRHGPPVFRAGRHIGSVENNFAVGYRIGSADQVEEGGFSRAVGTDDTDNIAFVHMQIDIVQSQFLVDRSRVEYFGDVAQIKHWWNPPSPHAWPATLQWLSSLPRQKMLHSGSVQ